MPLKLRNFSGFSFEAQSAAGKFIPNTPKSFKSRKYRSLVNQLFSLMQRYINRINCTLLKDLSKVRLWGRYIQWFRFESTKTKLMRAFSSMHHLYR